MYASGLKERRVLGTLKMLTGTPSSLSWRPSSRARLICMTHSWLWLISIDDSLAFSSEYMVSSEEGEIAICWWNCNFLLWNEREWCECVFFFFLLLEYVRFQLLLFLIKDCLARHLFIMDWTQEYEQVKKQNIVWCVIMTDFPHACYFYLLSFVTMI